MPGGQKSNLWLWQEFFRRTDSHGRRWCICRHCNGKWREILPRLERHIDSCEARKRVLGSAASSSIGRVSRFRLIPKEQAPSQQTQGGPSNSQRERKFLLVYRDHTPVQDQSGKLITAKTNLAVPIDAAAELATHPKILERFGGQSVTFKVYLQLHNPKGRYYAYNYSKGLSINDQDSSDDEKVTQNLVKYLSRDDDAEMSAYTWETFDTNGNLSSTGLTDSPYNDPSKLNIRFDHRYHQWERIFTRRESKIIYVFKVRFDANEEQQHGQVPRAIRLLKIERLMERHSEDFAPRNPPALLTLANTRYYYRGAEFKSKR